MTLIKNIRLGLLHVAIAMTFVLINSVLNRIMIHDLGILASVVAVLVVLPYILSPAQVWIGQYSDTHPMFGYRRTPYIALGTLLALAGAALAPHAALALVRDPLIGVPLAILLFGMWGVGYNLAVVAYLALASDMSTEQQRSRTVAIMWFMMIASVIVTAIVVGRALEPYSEERLFTVFLETGGVALALALVGLIGLEPRREPIAVQQSRAGQVAAIRAVLDNPQARIFFVYLIMMLAAILGQDVLLEPFGAQAFGMNVKETTQLTAMWGGATLSALLLYGAVLSRWMSKKRGAMIGGSIAATGFLLIALSGMLAIEAMFLPGIVLLGFGTGIATTTNLALMLDMTTAEQVGLFIGAWGVADALARGVGTLLGGVMRDVIAHMSGSAVSGYVSVFLIEALLLGISLVLLQRIDVTAFRSRQPSLTELVALSGDA
ncbi:BCD family MFS transporter [Roseiflexus castenholzii]|jgi:BCD family chlorophyll transporter-like MFS transporter|uniref:PUCC protein n=1 Tax=Roseiflexus castenholzii (strain DSM 13941 / HLO8) TaxID=383372 RepID=A7NJG6_ROSCS|nr:BCD family MFS transporter [Roseiflexus castenholzii]ABU57636.1 PUCC protein [Roseiflexus castenholzii DSM 13941]